MRKNHAYLKFTIDDKEHLYAGDDEKLLAIAQIAVVADQYYQDIAPQLTRMTHQSIIVGLIQRAGGAITQIHSIRPDGSWHAEDLPDYNVH